jgi:hypothetical protein
VNDTVGVESTFGAASASPAASVPDALVPVEDLPTPDGEGGGADGLPSARVPPFGTGPPDFSGAKGPSKADIGASNPLGGPYWAKSREPLVTRVSTNKPIRSLAALSFSSTNLAMISNILLISSMMWRPQNRSRLSTSS